MLKSLTQIINILKPGEVRLIRNYYKIQSNGEIKQRLNLFDLIKSKTISNDQEACQALYNCAPNSAYSHLKARLQKDILSLLLLQEGSKRYEAPYAQAIFDCRRMLIEGQMLIERGVSDIGVQVLTKAEMLAKKFELYNEDVAIADLLRTHQGIKRGTKEYNRYNTNIYRKADELIKLLKAKDYYYKITVSNIFKKNQEQHLAKFSEEALSTLSQYYTETKSGRIGFYYLGLKVYHHQIHQDMLAALDAVKAMIKLIEKSPSIYSTSRLAAANFQTGAILAYMGNYKEANKYATTACGMAVKGLMNELAAIEMIFLTALQAEDLKQSKATLERARNHPKINNNKTLPAKWDYYEANLLFKSGDYAAADRKLRSYSELLKDKAGWLLGHRILELMCMVQQDELELMDFRTESFRKLLQRQKGENIHRAKDILKVLETYVKSGGNHNKTMKKETRRLDLLRKAEGNYRWDPMGFELIRFDKWFDNLAVK